MVLVEERGRGRGRGVVAPSQGLTGSPTPGSPAPSTPEPGRCSRSRICRKEESDLTEVAIETRKRGRSLSVGGRGARRGRRFENSRFEGAITVTRAPDLQTKKGDSGAPTNLIVNYFRLRNTGSFALAKYRVDLTPELDDHRLKKRLLREHSQVLGSYIFDGDAMLFRMKRDKLDDNELSSQHPKDPSVLISIKIQEVGNVSHLDVGYSQVYNIIFRQCLHLVNLEKLGRHFYDMSSLIQVSEHHLNIAPGYITSIRRHEHEMLLCVDTTTKVIRTDTVLTRLQQLWRTYSDESEFRRKAAEEVVGTVVITTYRNRTYSIADIDWDANPTATFNWKGKPVSFVDYYKTAYGIDVADMKQPLLHAKSKGKNYHVNVNEEEAMPTYLIPELCNMTGMTIAMKSDFNLMRILSRHMHQDPAKKLNSVRNLVKKINASPQVQEYLEKWGLSFDNQLVQCDGRVLPGETIIFSSATGNYKEASKPVNERADWTIPLRESRMLSCAPLKKWTIIVPRRDTILAKQLYSVMQRVSKPVGFNFPAPARVIEINNTNIPGYLNAINEIQNQGNDLVFILLSSSTPSLYNAIKNRLTGELGQVSQCMLSSNLRSKALMTIATKLVVQINAKLGGEPWAVNIPLKKMMVVGVDLHRAKGMSQGRNVVAMVATTSSSYATFFSTVTAYNSSDELPLAICSDLMKCVLAYRKVNEEFPSRILLFREGNVSDGDLERIIGHEIRQINETLLQGYASKGLSKPQLTVVNVTRKVNSRIFKYGNNGPENPAHGTVCDDVITLPERYDFFLVPQVSRQGSVSPSAYNILCDDMGLGADKMQRLTYKLCHMYFNWSGTVAVPAPCQYARKLASLTGDSIQRIPTDELGFKLHFL